MANGTSRILASVCAISVLPVPVGPISRMLDFCSSTSVLRMRFIWMRLQWLYTATANFFLVDSCPMTYWSRNSFTSNGFGILLGVPEGGSTLSSSSMELHTAMHSSQMYARG